LPFGYQENAACGDRFISSPFHSGSSQPLLERGSFDPMKMVQRTQCDSCPAEKRRETNAHPA